MFLYKKLLENVLAADGYDMFTDRYYTRLSLAIELLKLKCHRTGTIKPNRKGLPQQIKKLKFSLKYRITMRKRNTLVLTWKDNRVVSLLSTLLRMNLKPVSHLQFRKILVDQLRDEFKTPAQP